MSNANEPTTGTRAKWRDDVVTVPLSVVIATTKAWPEIEPCLESLHKQAQAVGAEVLVGDGHGQGLPPDVAERYPEVTWIRWPGGSVFFLRELAMTKAVGDVVAVTEDHCTVTPGWCERILKVHRDHPEAAAIGGVVENGATTRLIDWSNFLIVFGPFTAPIENGTQRAISLQANVSYKRRVVPQKMSELGVMEFLFNRRLRDQGETLIADDQLIVSHNQTWGFWGTFAAHFHNGRSIAGFRLQRISWIERLIRLGGCAVLPVYLMWVTQGPVIRKKRLLKPALASLPLTVLVVTCHAAGEFVGYIFGPGNSPRQLA
ncbi:MAG: glycosyltransferase family 2 protein [Nitrospirae bacterium]|nr:glycosyltransferase family 2 protein [Nitrospirota bacterium]MDE3049425.1 glycosyltransferase family 2 protein [Nitrospirota bacterium]MDE3219862.1 glycosyltransferase family 2 protein [Nitrospirota bacterium]